MALTIRMATDRKVVEATLKNGVWTSIDSAVEEFLDLTTAMWHQSDHASRQDIDTEFAAAKFVADLLGGELLDERGRLEQRTTDYGGPAVACTRK